MLRLFARSRWPPSRYPQQRFCSQTSDKASHHLKDLSSPPSLLQKPLPSSPLSSLPATPRRSSPIYALTGTLISSIGLASYLFYPSSDDCLQPRSERIYASPEETIERSKGSVRRVLDQMKQTFATAAVLWNLFASVLSSANREIRSRFDLRVASVARRHLGREWCPPVGHRGGRWRGGHRLVA